MKYPKEKIMSHLYETKKGKCKKSIPGWWKDSAFDIYEANDGMQKNRNIEGNLCEIGTWFGRSFLPLHNFTKPNETCIGIDIFQHKKHQKYYNELIKNIRSCFGSLDGCKIIKISKSSTCEDKQQALKGLTPIRIFYIDGDHSYKGALLDLQVALFALHDNGIMFLDDYDNPRYGPDVTAAVNKFVQTNEDFVIAFTSSQRVFVCRKHMLEPYLEVMKSLSWVVGKDKVWKDLISFNHPLGYNAWQTTQTKQKRKS